MLVCNISQRPPGRTIASDIAEVLAATDALATGNVVFATLVDDPASVGETVDAYLGEIMLEAASADAVATAGSAFNAAVDEAAIAADTQDATAAAAPTGATWDAATVTAVTLSGGNLITTNTGTTSPDQGARVATVSGKTSGKDYFEITFTTLTAGGDRGAGVGTTASTYTGMGDTGGVTGVEMYVTGSVWSNGGSILGSVGSWTVGQVMGVAVDLDNRKIWFRNAPSGNWNYNATYNPATNTGGLTVPAGTMVPFVTFGGSGGAASNVFTANFGTAAFTGTVPSGFTSGWPV